MANSMFNQALGQIKYQQQDPKSVSKSVAQWQGQAWANNSVANNLQTELKRDNVLSELIQTTGQQYINADKALEEQKAFQEYQLGSVEDRKNWARLIKNGEVGLQHSPHFARELERLYASKSVGDYEAVYQEELVRARQDPNFNINEYNETSARAFAEEFGIDKLGVEPQGIFLKGIEPVLQQGIGTISKANETMAIVQRDSLYSSFIRDTVTAAAPVEEKSKAINDRLKKLYPELGGTYGEGSKVVRDSLALIARNNPALEAQVLEIAGNLETGVTDRTTGKKRLFKNTVEGQEWIRVVEETAWATEDKLRRNQAARYAAENTEHLANLGKFIAQQKEKGTLLSLQGSPMLDAWEQIFALGITGDDPSLKKGYDILRSLQRGESPTSAEDLKDAKAELTKKAIGGTIDHKGESAYEYALNILHLNDEDAVKYQKTYNSLVNGISKTQTDAIKAWEKDVIDPSTTDDTTVHALARRIPASDRSRILSEHRMEYEVQLLHTMSIEDPEKKRVGITKAFDDYTKAVLADISELANHKEAKARKIRMEANEIKVFSEYLQDDPGLVSQALSNDKTQEFQRKLRNGDEEGAREAFNGSGLMRLREKMEEQVGHEISFPKFIQLVDDVIGLRGSGETLKTAKPDKVHKDKPISSDAGREEFFKKERGKPVSSSQEKFSVISEAHASDKPVTQVRPTLVEPVDPKAVAEVYNTSTVPGEQESWIKNGASWMSLFNEGKLKGKGSQERAEKRVNKMHGLLGGPGSQVFSGELSKLQISSSELLPELDYILAAETGFGESETYKNSRESKSGALGLMQIKPSTVVSLRDESGLLGSKFAEYFGIEEEMWMNFSNDDIRQLLLGNDEASYLIATAKLLEQRFAGAKHG